MHFKANLLVGIKINRSKNFSSIKILSSPCVLCRLGLLMLKTEEQTLQTEHLAEKLQERNQNSH